MSIDFLLNPLPPRQQLPGEDKDPEAEEMSPALSSSPSSSSPSPFPFSSALPLPSPLMPPPTLPLPTLPAFSRQPFSNLLFPLPFPSPLLPPPASPFLSPPAPPSLPSLPLLPTPGSAESGSPLLPLPALQDLPFPLSSPSAPFSSQSSPPSLHPPPAAPLQGSSPSSSLPRSPSPPPSDICCPSSSEPSSESDVILPEEAEDDIITSQTLPHQQKIDRIRQKTFRLASSFPITPGQRQQIDRLDLDQILRQVPEPKMRKKTVNKLAAALAYQILRKVGSRVEVREVVGQLQWQEKSHSLSRCSKKPNYSRNHSDVLAILKLVSSLEGSLDSSLFSSLSPPSPPASPPLSLSLSIPASSLPSFPSPHLLTPTSSSPPPSLPQPPQPHAQTTQDITLLLLRKLGIASDSSDPKDQELQRMALQLSSFSEHSSLASRHHGSVGAGCILLAARETNRRLTLTLVSKVSGISSCTIRKAMKALEELALKRLEKT